MIYGANGYTGVLIAREAVVRGMTPILAGRNRDQVEGLGKTLGLEARVFALEESGDVIDATAGMTAVLHAAGPYSATFRPMVDACLANRCTYLDITGEIAVFEALHDRDERASEAGIVILPGVGFDVVPTDCLAARVLHFTPDAGIAFLQLFVGGPRRQPGYSPFEKALYHSTPE